MRDRHAENAPAAGRPPPSPSAPRPMSDDDLPDTPPEPVDAETLPADPFEPPPPAGRPKLRKRRLLLTVIPLVLLAIVSTIFGMMMALARELPNLETAREFAPELRITFASPVTDDITRAFEAARYAGREPDARAIEDLRRRWQHEANQPQP